MRRPFIAGNWKMNKTTQEAIAFATAFVPTVADVRDKDILICPPFTALSAVNAIVKGTKVALGAQNCAFAASGAYTGEVAPKMLTDVGCAYVIIGHSERRKYYGETDVIINQKITNAFSAGLKVIVCVGETLEEREAGKTFSVIETQTRGGLKNIDMTNIVIAYEPVWAIGTGKTATPEQAQEVHAFIRTLLSTMYNAQIADTTRILYGGSVTPETIKDLMACPDVDGGLVGGASLKVDAFLSIVQNA